MINDSDVYDMIMMLLKMTMMNISTFLHDCADDDDPHPTLVLLTFPPPPVQVQRQ